MTDISDRIAALETMPDTFAHLAEIYDANWLIVTWKGHGDAEKQTVTIVLRKRKGVPQVYREGIAQ